MDKSVGQLIDYVLHPLTIILTVLSAVAAVLSALLHIRRVGAIDDEIRYLSSEQSIVEFYSSDRYNMRYGKYLVHADESKVHGPDEIRSKVIQALEETRRRTKNWSSFFAVLAALAAILAVFLDFGL